jgi:hypothetical protein
MDDLNDLFKLLKHSVYEHFIPKFELKSLLSKYHPKSIKNASRPYHNNNLSVRMDDMTLIAFLDVTKKVSNHAQNGMKSLDIMSLNRFEKCLKVV